jgi:hypothetical protein
MSTELDRLAAAPIDELDLSILGRLAHVQDVADPVPAGLIDRITFELTLRRLEAEIAELTDGSELLTVRSGVQAERTDTISFTASAVSLMITLSPEPSDEGTVRIDAWVTTPGVVVELWQDGNSFPATADGDGRLAWERVVARPSRFLVAGTPPVVTPTIDL